MKLSQLIGYLETFAPLNLAGSWDKVGLQVGDTALHVKKILLCIDLTPPVIAQAIDQKTHLIIAYHPPIFSPLTALRSDNPKQNILLQAIKHDIAIYTPHTALDAATGGVNDFLASAFDFATAQPLEPLPQSNPITHKLIVYCPASHTHPLRQSLSQAANVQIGPYTHCSFTAQGLGTFLPGAAAKPYIGKTGQLQKVPEDKLEIPCDAHTDLAHLIDVLLKNHPYEQPAYELIPLADLPEPPHRAQGAGRLVTLKKQTSIQVIVTQIKTQLKLEHLKLALPTSQRLSTKIKTIALCPGAGASLFQSVKADLYYTGEMSHHQVLEYTQQQSSVILTGHTNNERPYLKHYKKIIDRITQKQLHITLSSKDQAPACII